MSQTIDGSMTRAMLRIDGVSFDIANSLSCWKALLLMTAQEIGATVIKTNSHQFKPQGFTTFIMLKESHISAHSFPEYGIVHITIETCSSIMDYQKGIKFILSNVEHSKYHLETVKF